MVMECWYHVYYDNGNVGIIVIVMLVSWVFWQGYCWFRGYYCNGNVSIVCIMIMVMFESCVHSNGNVIIVCIMGKVMLVLFVLC